MGIKKFWKKKNLKKIFGRQMSFEIIGASKATWGYWGAKCHPGALGCQMTLGGIGASNATWGYWGVKCHQGVLGRQMPPWYYGGVKGHTGVKRPASRFMRSQILGRQRSGASGIRLGVRGQNSGVRVHVVKGPGRQRRWIPICWIHANLLKSLLYIDTEY